MDRNNTNNSRAESTPLPAPRHDERQELGELRTRLANYESSRGAVPGVWQTYFELAIHVVKSAIGNGHANHNGHNGDGRDGRSQHLREQIAQRDQIHGPHNQADGPDGEQDHPAAK
jgi:hypothetical protein